MRPPRLSAPSSSFLAGVLTAAVLAAGAGQAGAATGPDIAVSPDPIEASPATITVTGSVDEPRRLVVVVLPAASSCADDGLDDGEALSDADGDEVTGSYDLHYSFTPGQTGEFRVCGFVLDPAPEYPGYPSAQAEATFEARRNVAELTIGPFDASVAGTPVRVSLFGTTEVGRRLFARALPGSVTCPEAVTGLASSDGDWLSAPGGDLVDGPFLIEPSFVPLSAGHYTVCAAVATSASGPTDTSATAPLVVESPVVDPTTPPAPTTPDPTTPTVPTTPAPTTPVVPTTPATPTTPVVPTTPAVPTTPIVRTTPPTPTATTPPTPAPRPDPPTPEPAPTPPANPPANPAPLAAPVDPDAKYVPALITDGAQQFDRLRLRWTARTQASTEILTLWDADPADDNEPILAAPVTDDDQFEIENVGSGRRDLRVRTFLGFRRFWWQVEVRTPSGKTVLSEIRTVTVVPSPIVKSAVRIRSTLSLKRSSAHPGTVRVRIDASPRAQVRLEIRWHGRLWAKRAYTAGVGMVRGFDFTLSCAQTGQFAYTARIKDPYGTRVVRKGSWTVSATRCASLRAAEARKAAEARRRAEAKRRREQERERQEREADQAPASTGGSGCDPNYSGACLDPDASDYDCAGGSGDGPEYVEGPVTVVGDDHYGLDSDNDGVGCES